ncbi:hypothetical protein N5079_24095 [Planotetraspora sp. A-T 1434]|uniref:hypothetical protein n=1 Tax=Planotetraspora sp. A-T 1434 TaxID=2979219 RepID=UPI0021BE968D|nr:hypothetical protein [Planotetraspora sp. A-T 1434]MCT9933298.1 hypothetical protein [Planotetraspora sp. A-T 1434]
MTRVIERADQLVLEYVSRVADAAHGRLRPDQRLEFVRRLRERVEQERGGSDDARHVQKVIARFGPPGALVDREIRRLAAAHEAAQPIEERSTAVIPVVVDRAGPSVPPPGRRRLPTAGRRTAGSPRAARRSEVAAVLLNHRRETLAMSLLAVAGLLVPFRFAAVAIFPVPGLVWALGALTVLACEAWSFNDRVIGLSTPVVAYLAGGTLLGAARAGSGDIQSFLAAFHSVSGVLFVLGTAAGVFWLAHRLLNPPSPPPPRQLVIRR